MKRTSDLINATLILGATVFVVGLVLRFGLGGYDSHRSAFVSSEYRQIADYACEHKGEELPEAARIWLWACDERPNTEWVVGTSMAEWSLTYLVVVGSTYGLIRFLGGGRLRSFARWFWQGEQQ